MLYDGIIKFILREDSQENNDFSFDNTDTFNEEENESRDSEAFYLTQNVTNINIDSCLQLRNPKNIKLIEH